MQHQKVGARAEYRQEEGQRIRNSASIVKKFPELKTLTVELAYYTSDGVNKSSQFKYMVNLESAKSAFCFDCRNKECVRGDFDLVDELTNAVTGHYSSVNGEKRCLGWRSKTTIVTARCPNILRYKFTLGYKPVGRRKIGSR